MSERKEVYDAEHPTPADQSAARQRLISQLLESQAEVKRLMQEVESLQRENAEVRELLDRSLVGVKEQDAPAA